MMHFTCDRCGCSIREERFIARIEVVPAFDPDEITEEDLDEDHLEQIADAIAAMESTGDFALEANGPRKLQFDLCPNCCRRFLKSPLEPSLAVRLNFSQN